jgi:hypothetical protein
MTLRFVLITFALACFEGLSEAANANVAVVMNVTTSPRQVFANSDTSLNVSFAKLPGHQPLQSSSFLVSHDQLLHFVAVGADLDTFAHRHPSKVRCTECNALLLLLLLRSSILLLRRTI